MLRTKMAAVGAATRLFSLGRTPHQDLPLEDAFGILGDDHVFSPQAVSTLVGEVHFPSKWSYRLPYTKKMLCAAAESGGVAVWEGLSLRQLSEYIDRDSLQVRLADKLRFQYDVGALKIPQWSLVAMGKGSMGSPFEYFERSLRHGLSVPSVRTIVAAAGYSFLLNRKLLFGGRPLFSGSLCGNERVIVRQQLYGEGLQIRLSFVSRDHREPALGTPIVWDPVGLATKRRRYSA